MVNAKLVEKYFVALELPMNVVVNKAIVKRQYQRLSKIYNKLELNKENVIAYQLIKDAYIYITYNIEDINAFILSGNITYVKTKSLDYKKESTIKAAKDIYDNIQRSAYNNKEYIEMFNLTAKFELDVENYNSIEEVDNAFSEYIKKLSKIKTIEQIEISEQFTKSIQVLLNICLIVAVLAFYAIFVWVPSIRYKKAIDAMYNGDYDYARRVLTSLNEYSDAKNELLLIDVYKACNDNNYAEAERLMNNLGFEISFEYLNNGGTIETNGNITYAFLNGYSFDGWELKEYSFDKTKLSVKLKAIFSLETYSITYIWEEEVSGIRQYDVNSAFFLPTLTRFGYAFNGWTSTDGKIVDATQIKKGTTGDLILTPSWKADDYQVIIDTDDGTLPGDIPTTYSMDTGTFKIGEPEKAGYTFVGWTTNFNSTPQKEIEIEEGSFGNLKLTAHYEKNTYSINYNLNGGEGELSETYQSFTTGGINEPTKKGYDFVGWSSEEHPEPTKDYEFGYGDVELTANWQVKTFNVYYDVNGGVIIDYPYQEITYGEEYEPYTPQRTGYNFDGWYVNGVKIDPSCYEYDEAVTMKAKWIPRDDINYVVNHYRQDLETLDYTIKESEVLMGVADSVIRPSIINYAGFILPPVQEVSVNPNGMLVVDYYYTRNSYNVNYYSNGGVDIETKSLLYEKFIEDEETSRSGYTFAGWYMDEELTKVFTLYEMPSYSINLYAKWEEETAPSAFLYQLVSDNEDYPNEYYEIIGYTEKCTGDIVIPSFIGNTPVSKINDNAFVDAPITSITINANIIYVGSEVFNQNNLVVNIENSSIPLTWEANWYTKEVVINYLK